MTDDELAEIIEALQAGQTDKADVEAKAASRDLPRSVRESLSAFSNTTGGGVIVLGLAERDGFATTGVQDAGKIQADAAAMCRTDMEPALSPQIQVHQVDGANLVVIEVPELDPQQKPCFYKPAGMTNGSYIRVADGDYRLNAYEVQMLVSSRGQPHDDDQPVEAATINDLDDALVGRLITRVRETRPRAFADLEDHEVLKRLHVLRPFEARLVPSVAGLLALGKYPQDYLPQLNMTFVHYPTVDGGAIEGERFLDNRVIEGPIPEMVQEAMAILRRNMKRRATVSGAGRLDAWEYPETALREAIVNALAHRDLSPQSQGTPVQIEMYPDRLVIRNPGGLFGPVNVYQLGEEGVSSSRNAVLLKVLEDVPLPVDDRTVCENRGSGIMAMIQALRAADMALPDFSNRIGSFQVTFANHTLMSDDVVGWISRLGEEALTASQCLGLALMRDGQKLTNATYRAATGVDSRVATHELHDLVARELVDQANTRRWATYSIAPRALAIEPRDGGGRGRLSPADRRPEILSALGDKTRARSEIVNMTGLKSQTVRRWLLILRNEGLIEIIGKPQSNKARYRALYPQGQMSLDIEREASGAVQILCEREKRCARVAAGF